MNKIKTIWQALGKLRDDKEDTTQVFTILSVLGERAGQQAYKRFMRHNNAQDMLNAPRDLMAHLCDSEWLQSLPVGSLGREYYDFTTREKISADGLAQASDEGTIGDRYKENEQQGRFSKRQRDAHDLWHVVTGYGRDELGEISLLAVTWRQLGNVGILLIIGLGVSEMRATLGLRRSWHVLAEGFRLGRRAKWLPEAQWEYLLTQPLSEVRAQLNITPPRTYRETLIAYPEILEAI
ncbi:MAG: hypothetical protein HAW65_04185 [Alphaproteobacteria bacterium]|nr:hypothetical protein [Alphaproteobacteria bacterium]